jgi:outer membrane murein-binding lipoprotein Lpp
MSDTPSSDDRLNRLEITMGKAVSSIETLAQTMATVVDKTDQLTSHVSRLEAGQGKIPTGTIFATLSTLISGFGLVLFLTLGPLNAKVDELETSNRTTIEEHVPNLASDMANLKARMQESEAKTGILFTDPTVGVLSNALWRGQTQNEIESMRVDVDDITSRNRLNGWSRQDHESYHNERRRYDELLRKYITDRFERNEATISEDKDDLDDLRTIIKNQSSQ